MTIRSRSGRPLLVVALTVLALCLPGIAAAQDALTLELDDVTFDADGTTDIEVTVLGAESELLGPDAFTIVESGETLDVDVEVTPYSELTERDPVTVVLLLDVSGSTQGEPLDAAKAASIDLAAALTADGAEVALVPFGDQATVAVPPTSEVDQLTTAIGALEAGGETAAYDAVVTAADLIAGREGERQLVLFTDGGDTVSEASLTEAVAATASAEAPLTTVALDTPEQDPDALATLASGAGGELLTVDGTAGLTAAFEQVAEALTSRYQLTYVGDDLSPELDLEVTVAVGDASSTAGATYLNRRVARADVLPEPPPAQTYDSGVFGEDWVLLAAAGVAFVGLALFLLILLVPRGDREATRTLRRGLGLVTRRGQDAQPSTGLSATALGQRAIELVDSVPKPAGYDERLQARLDRGGWQLRGGEFVAMRVGGALVGLALLGALSGSLILGVIGGVIGAFVPVVLLANATQRRQTAFRDQLPETLQLLSGTLKAGYGALQGIDTIVKETRPPMNQEFQRVLTESRLGLPLEDSLDAMAERMDDEDFRWVVVSMNIQRQVGGNLAQLLETVSETLRERETTRRQIKVLSAEGRLSAVILLALPFLLVGYLLFVNPEYIMTLFEDFVGLVMVGGSMLLMVVGFFWMRKLVRIDV